MPHLIQGIEAFSRGTQRIYINKYIYIQYIYIYVKDLQKQEYSEYGRYENKL